MADHCVLSAEEAGCLENYGQWPKCKHHRHIKKREAIAGVQAGEYRFVGGEDTKVNGPVSMVTAVRVTMWEPVAANGADGTKLMGMRTWGLKPRR